MRRVDIVGMGCHAGLNAMATAAHWAEAHPGEVAMIRFALAPIAWRPKNNYFFRGPLGPGPKPGPSSLKADRFQNLYMS